MTTITFASYELNRYVAQMGCSHKIDMKVDEKNFDTTKFQNFDAFFDDAFSIEVTNGTGCIIGINERSVLLGVYHFLKQQGCRFLRPGQDGEYVPFIEKLQDVSECWYAAVRHRGTSSAWWGGGGRGLVDMLAYIDWMPKMMMNSFFIELTDYYCDIYALLENVNNPYKSAEYFPRELFNEYDKRVVEEIKKRSLIRHGAGHGWGVELMEGIEEVTRKVDNAVCTNTEILAEIQGERKLFKGKSMYTNLCYSQDDVRKKWAEAVYKCSVQHPEIDVIHIWLADYFSNFCECENCRKLSQSDWYVKLLNEIDEEFTKHGSNKKLSFLIYFELAYPPMVERIKNEDRFIMMFAPYGRDFTKTYKECPATDYVRKPLNQFDWEDMRMEYYLKQLQEWQEIFKGDSFVFDYTLLERASECEVTDMLLGSVLHEDCLRLKEYGLNGRIDCINTRAMTPTAVEYHAMFEAMFYQKESYEEIEKDYFTNSYGEEEPIREFLHTISKLLPREYMLLRTATFSETDKDNLSKGLELIRDFKNTIKCYVPKHPSQVKNCYYFSEYLDILECIFNALFEKSKGLTVEDMEPYIEEYRHLIFRKEAIMPAYMSGDAWFKHIKSTFTNTDEHVQF